MEQINNGPLFLALKSEREHRQLHIGRSLWKREIFVEIFSDEKLFR